MKYIIDEQGKWKINGCCKMLIEPSETYIAKREKEQQIQLEQEKLDSLVPNDEEVRKAETDLQIASFLKESGLI